MQSSIWMGWDWVVLLQVQPSQDCLEQDILVFFFVEVDLCLFVFEGECPESFLLYLSRRRGPTVFLI